MYVYHDKYVQKLEKSMSEKKQKGMSGMGFEPMPTFVDQILSLAP